MSKSALSNYSVFNPPKQQICQDLPSCQKEVANWKQKYQIELPKIQSLCNKVESEYKKIKDTSQQCQLDLLSCRMGNLKSTPIPSIKKGGNLNEDKYYQKYVKYKTKYLELKQKNNNF